MKRLLEYWHRENCDRCFRPGSDSTHAADCRGQNDGQAGWSRENILGYTMPGFATSDITLINAHGLMKSLGITAREIDIKPSWLQMLRDIAHPFVDGEPVYDITFENVQAGERTFAFVSACQLHNGLVLGTGDCRSSRSAGPLMRGRSHEPLQRECQRAPNSYQHLIRWVMIQSSSMKKPVAFCRAVSTREILAELVPTAGEKKTNRHRARRKKWAV
jgi:NAD+ synthase (glutamine-hydrolysing)